MVGSFAGTNLGDPIELAAASAVLNSAARQMDSAAPLTLAAGKSAIGHTEPAAGLAGIYHSVQSMQAHLTQPILHFRQVRFAALWARLAMTFTVKCTQHETSPFYAVQVKFTAFQRHILHSSGHI